MVEGVTQQFMAETVLPERALLKGVMDVIVPTREQALELVELQVAARRRGSSHKHRDRRAALAMDACWEATVAMELAARVVKLVVEPAAVPSGKWVSLLHYESVKADQFFQCVHKLSDGQLEALAGVRAHDGNDWVFWPDQLFVDGSDSAAISALRTAGRATGQHLKTVLLELAQRWKEFKRISHAAEHGFVYFPSEYASVVEADGTVVSFDVLALETQKDAGFGTEASWSDVVNAAASAARRALQLVTFVADVRLRFMDSLDCEAADGRLKSDWHFEPHYWFREEAVAPEMVDVLDAGFSVTWVTDAE